MAMLLGGALISAGAAQDEPPKLLDVPESALQYPGAVFQQVTLSEAGTPGMVVVYLMFATADPPESVAAYFADLLAPFGDVWVGEKTTDVLPFDCVTVAVKRAGCIPLFARIGRAPRSFRYLVPWQSARDPEDDETKIVWFLMRPIPRPEGGGAAARDD